MKKIVTLSFTLALVLVSVKSFTYRSGGVQGYTNAPSEGNCISCHTGTSLNGGSGSTFDMTLIQMLADWLQARFYIYVKAEIQANVYIRFGFSITALDDKNKEPAGDFTITSTRTQKRTKTVSVKHASMLSIPMQVQQQRVLIQQSGNLNGKHLRQMWEPSSFTQL